MTFEQGSKLRPFLQLIILAFGLFLFIMALYYNNYRTKSPLPDQALCNSCHSMQANITTWKVTSHGQIGCSKCHDDVSLSNVVSKELTGRYIAPIEKRDPVSNKLCLDCHNSSRLVTGPGDLIIPHKLHIEKQIDCVRCHSNVAHGKVVQEVLLAKNVGPKDIDEEIAKDLTSFGNRVPMADCMPCHNNTKADGSCAACHTNKPIPSSHDKEFMTFAHKDTASKDIASCVACHEYDVKKQARFNAKDKGFDSVRNNTRDNDFCQGCHQQRPVTHDANFIINHPKGMNNKNSCLVCHDKRENELTKAPAAKNIYCNTCHHNETTHTKNYLREHPTDLRSKDPNSCFSCHNANSCESCHVKYGINKK